MKSSFGRRKKQREMLIRNLACSLILQESLVTTKEKGKEVKRFLERLISRAKKQKALHPFNCMRTLKRSLPDVKAVEKAYDILTETYKDLTGGYVRIFPYLPRKSDNAKRVKIVLR